MATKRKPNPLKRKELGMGGVVLLLSQLLSNYQSSQKVSNQVQELRASVEKNRLERELYFVRKEEMVKVATKLESMDDKLNRIKSQIKKFHDIELSKRADPNLFSLNELRLRGGS